jgi:hypothetical protein
MKIKSGISFGILPQLEVLANGKFSKHHWQTLFEQCNQAGKYHEKIKISDLQELGILKAKDKILEISQVSHDESLYLKKSNTFKHFGIKYACLFPILN